jgi:hypothetical protein
LDPVDGSEASLPQGDAAASGTGTEIEDALIGCDLPMLDEGFTIVTGPEDCGIDHEMFIEICNQLSCGIHLAKLHMQSPSTNKDAGL